MRGLYRDHTGSLLKSLIERVLNIAHINPLPGLQGFLSAPAGFAVVGASAERRKFGNQAAGGRREPGKSGLGFWVCKLGYFAGRR